MPVIDGPDSPEDSKRKALEKAFQNLAQVEYDKLMELNNSFFNMREGKRLHQMPGPGGFTKEDLKWLRELDSKVKKMKMSK